MNETILANRNADHNSPYGSDERSAGCHRYKIFYFCSSINRSSSIFNQLIHNQHFNKTTCQRWNPIQPKRIFIKIILSIIFCFVYLFSSINTSTIYTFLRYIFAAKTYILTKLSRRSGILGFGLIETNLLENYLNLKK